jgi:hypothetical protein
MKGLTPDTRHLTPDRVVWCDSRQVIVLPRGEPFPNMLAETGFVAHLGPSVVSTCAPIETKALPVEQKDVDYVLLREVPETVTPGQVRGGGCF